VRTDGYRERGTRPPGRRADKPGGPRAQQPAHSSTVRQHRRKRARWWLGVNMQICDTVAGEITWPSSGTVPSEQSRAAAVGGTWSSSPHSRRDTAALLQWTRKLRYLRNVSRHAPNTADSLRRVRAPRVRTCSPRVRASKLGSRPQYVPIVIITLRAAAAMLHAGPPTQNPSAPPDRLGT
jgi:hypothetical protein